ncbi:hypothetical protein ACOMHN_055108 [Nucella lapillus]
MVDFDGVSSPLCASDTVADCLDDGLSLQCQSLESESWSTESTTIMRREDVRLETFRHWPPGWDEKLARYGFCSISQDNSGSVKCVFCGLCISNFASPEEARLLHWRSARHTCPYLKGEDVRNIPLNENSRTSCQKTPAPTPQTVVFQQTHPPRPSARVPGSEHPSWREEEFIHKHGGFSCLIECPPPKVEVSSGSYPTAASQEREGSGPSTDPKQPQPTKSVPWQEIVRTAQCPAMAFYQARLKTLSRWPLLKPSPAELAKAGFFHVKCHNNNNNNSNNNSNDTSPTVTTARQGPGGRLQRSRGCVGDVVRCFWCGVKVHRWQSTDGALLEHARFSPGCVYVIQVLGQQLHDDVVRSVNAVTTGTTTASRHDGDDDDDDDRRDVTTLPVRSHTSSELPSSGAKRPLSNAHPSQPSTPLTTSQLDHLMQSPPVHTVLQMGFPPHLIRSLLSHNSQRLTADTLCHLALQASAEQTTATRLLQPPTSSLPQQQSVPSHTFGNDDAGGFKLVSESGQNHKRVSGFQSGGGPDFFWAQNPERMNVFQSGGGCGDSLAGQTEKLTGRAASAPSRLLGVSGQEEGSQGTRGGGGGRLTMCKVCSEAEAQVMFRPCNHLVCCLRCTSLFTSCPVCHGIIEDVLTADLSELKL